MYVARRAFRNNNHIVLPGSIVEPGSIKWFKTRLKDRVIVEVNAHNFKQWSEYFKAKFGVTLVNDVPNNESINECVGEYIDVQEDASKEEPKKAPKVVKVVVATTKN